MNKLTKNKYQAFDEKAFMYLKKCNVIPVPLLIIQRYRQNDENNIKKM